MRAKRCYPIFQAKFRSFVDCEQHTSSAALRFYKYTTLCQHTPQPFEYDFWLRVHFFALFLPIFPPFFFFFLLAIFELSPFSLSSSPICSFSPCNDSAFWIKTSFNLFSPGFSSSSGKARYQLVRWLLNKWKCLKFPSFIFFYFQISC